MPPSTCTKKARPAPGKTSPLSLGPPWPHSPASPGPSGSNALTLSPSQPWSPVHTQAPSRLAHGCQPMPEHPAKVPCPPLPRAVPPQLLPLHPPFLGLWLKALYSVFPAWSIISCLVTHMTQNAGLFPYGGQPLSLCCKPLPLGEELAPISTRPWHCF